MNYNLNSIAEQEKKSSSWTGLKNLLNLVAEERKRIFLSLSAILVSASLNLLGPFLIGYTIDHYVQTGKYHGVLVFAGILLGMYSIAFVSSYLQTQWMGGVAQRAIFKLRNVIFNKIQQLPVAFFNENKAGDLISRVNNDTDKLSQFFSQALMQFISSIITMIGSGVFLLSINIKLGLATTGTSLSYPDFYKKCFALGKKKECVKFKKLWWAKRRNTGKPEQL
ncbi:ABC transporter transmembrane domain-containing protein [Pedobacter panaciterrae]